MVEERVGDGVELGVFEEDAGLLTALADTHELGVDGHGGAQCALPTTEDGDANARR